MGHGGDFSAGIYINESPALWADCKQILRFQRYCATCSRPQALDESLWESPEAGAAEVFDANALVDWLETWNEIGDTFAADRLAAMSDDYRALCLSHMVTVGIHHTLAFLAIPDDEVDVERDTLQPVGSCALYGPRSACCERCAYSTAPNRCSPLRQLAGG